jgi:hypothetical protein
VVLIGGFTDMVMWIHYPDYCEHTGRRIIGTRCYCRRHELHRKLMPLRRNWIIWAFYKIKPLATFPHPTFKKLGWM